MTRETDNIWGGTTGFGPKGLTIEQLNNEQQFALVMLGRSLQSDPEVPLLVHQARVEDDLEHLVPNGGIIEGAQLFGISDVARDHTDRFYALAHNNYPSGLPTVFYRSRSHAVWRALLIKGVDGWFAKGMFGVENSTDAPIRLQKIFDKRAEQPLEELPLVHLPTVLAIPDQSGGRGEKSLTARDGERLMQRYGISSIPRFAEEDIVYEAAGKLFKEGKKPDFGSILGQWETAHSLYGHVGKMVCHSRDETIKYLINESEYAGKVQRWVGTAEVVGAAITGLALRNLFIQLPEVLTRPPIDYGPGDDDGYSDRRLERSRFDHFAARSLAAYKGIEKHTKDVLNK